MKRALGKILIIITVPFIFLGLSACVKKDDTPKSDITEQHRIPFLKIDNETIYQDEFFDFSASALREMSESSYDNDEVKDALIKSFIEHRLLLKEALRRGIKIDENRLSKVLSSFSSRQGAQDLKVYSGSYKMDNKKLAELMRQRMLVDALINKVAGETVNITEDQVKEYYKNNYNNSQDNVKAHIFQIFTTNKKTADKAMGELKKGLSFNEVAERYSESPEGTSGGDLGVVSKSDMPEIFTEAFSLEPNQISDIKKSEYGYHIFLVKKFITPKQIDYDSVKDGIYADLYAKEQQAKTKEFTDELYKTTKIEHLSDIDLHDFTGK